MAIFSAFKDFRGEAIIVNIEQIIFVRPFGSYGKTEIGFGAGQKNEPVCIVVEGTLSQVVAQLEAACERAADGGLQRAVA